MDEGKGGQTRGLQEREGGNMEKSEGKEKTGSAGPGRLAGKGEGWGGQKAHDGGLGDGVAEASRALSKAVVAPWRY